MLQLFDELRIRDVRFPHRLAVSPMCQYSSVDGYATDWHLVHLGSRAVGGAALIFTEAAAVTDQGRISPQDLGIWQDGHIDMLARITRFLHQQGSVSGIQLAHAGRKAGTVPPWEGIGSVPHSQGGWTPTGPSAIPFADGYESPRELTEPELCGIVHSFAQAASRALDAGFLVAEIHAAHGYLLQEFLSPLSNRRTDRYGGSFDNRIRLLCEVVSETRKVWPERLPLFVRISSTDWHEAGWTVDESVDLARRLGPLGVDLIDCSSGGNAPNLKTRWDRVTRRRLRSECGAKRALRRRPWG